MTIDLRPAGAGRQGNNMDVKSAVEWWQVVISLGTGSIAGLGALLASGKRLTKRKVASAMINSGLAAVAAWSVVRPYWAGDLLSCIGISALAGVGGANLLALGAQGLERLLVRKLNPPPS